ncbi:alpha/beta hydrolase [Roseobacteraceae bacterium NS-SX3]
MRDWDDAFDNMGHVAGSEGLPAFWAARAADYRAGGVRIDTCAYGAEPRARFDLIHPEGVPRGLAVFVHGGYWMRLDKSYWSDLAEGARQRGWLVCIPSYTLAPEARIPAITRQAGAAIAEAASRVDGPIRLAGHSAGGHLVCRMLCADSPLPRDVLARVERTLSISGLHDLRPLLRTRMNQTLGLTPDSASAESPALNQPQGQPDLHLWAGGGERPEFLRQARLMALMWDGCDARTRLTIKGEHNHFTVLDGLKDPESAIARAWAE